MESTRVSKIFIEYFKYPYIVLQQTTQILNNILIVGYRMHYISEYYYIYLKYTFGKWVIKYCQ